MKPNADSSAKLSKVKVFYQNPKTGPLQFFWPKCD